MTETATTPGAAQPTGERSVGQAITTRGGVEATAVSVRRGVPPDGEAAGAEELGRGEQWVVLTIHIRNASNEAIEDDTGNFVLLDARDQVYRSTCCASHRGELGDSAFSVAPGQARRGIVVFKVPRAARNRAVLWESAPDGPLEWAVP